MYKRQVCVGGGGDSGNNGSVSSTVTIISKGQETTISLTGSDLGECVGLWLSFSLAIVDMMGSVGDVRDSIGGSGDNSSIGDDTNIVSSALSNSIGHMGSAGNLTQGPGLGITGHGSNCQAQLKINVVRKISMID